MPLAAPVLRGPYFGGGNCDKAACTQNQKGRVFERGDVGEDKFPQNSFLEAQAIVEGGINDHGDDWLGCCPDDRDPMQQSTERQCELDCKGDGDIATPQKAKGDDIGQGRGIGLEGERQGGNAEAYNAGEEETDICIFF